MRNIVLYNENSFSMKSYFLWAFILLIGISCQNKNKNRVNAQIVVDKAIEVSGKESFKNTKISFRFREKTYISKGHCNHFIFERITKKSDSIIKDFYEPGKSLKRYVQDSLIQIADTTATKYIESINSVFYFVQLPYRLNDEAVNKKYLGLDTINGKTYHNIAVNFDKKDGGTDYEDEYLYWFDENTFKLDYLAYSFKINGGGMRFREAYNERIIEDIRFVDYKNYKPKTETLELKNISKAFKNNELELLSKIENENISVKKNREKC